MMKRLVFSILMILALTAGATFAQSTLNTTPPGPTQQQEPGLTNNNLPNPGTPVPTPQAERQQPVQEQGTVEGTATESINGAQGSNTTGNVTGTTTGTMDTTGTTTGTTDTTGTMNTTGTTTTGTTTTGTSTLDTTTTGTTTGSYSTGTATGAETDTTTTGTSNLSDTDTLPSTASALPLLGLVGLLAFAAAFAVRRF
jgi:hypothetical protein